MKVGVDRRWCNALSLIAPYEILRNYFHPLDLNLPLALRKANQGRMWGPVPFREECVSVPAQAPEADVHRRGARPELTLLHLAGGAPDGNVAV